MTADTGDAAATPRVLTPFVLGLLTVLVPSAVVVIVGGGLAVAARARAEELSGTWFGGVDLGMDGHVLVLVVLFWLLVVMTRALWGNGGGRVVAIVVVLLAAAGPGSLAGSPAFSWTVDPRYTFDSTGVVLWWPWVVALGWTAFVLSTALWTLHRYPVTDSGTYVERGRFLIAVLAYAGYSAAASSVADFWLDPGHVELGFAMQLGWTALAAGLLTGAATTPSLVNRVALALLAPALMAQMYFAYNSGGWPMVPGWEESRSPLFSTVGVAVLVGTAPLVGWLVGVAGRALERVVVRRLPRQAPTGVPTT